MRRAFMCPCQQDFKIAPFTFADKLHGTVVQVTCPSRDAESASLLGGRSPKENALYSAADDYADARPFVAGHDAAPSDVVAVNSFTNSCSSRIFTPSSRAL